MKIKLTFNDEPLLTIFDSTSYHFFQTYFKVICPRLVAGFVIGHYLFVVEQCLEKGRKDQYNEESCRGNTHINNIMQNVIPNSLEEIFFRGVVPRCIQKALDIFGINNVASSWISTIISSLVYSIFESERKVTAFHHGMVYSGLRFFSGSHLPSLAAHAGQNMLTLEDSICNSSPPSLSPYLR